MTDRISAVRITPVAFDDPPLLNTVGVHQPFALRAIVEIETADGLLGLGESYADRQHLQLLEVAGQALLGADPTNHNRAFELVAAAIGRPAGPKISSGLVGDTQVLDRVFAPFDVALLDLEGHRTGLSVSELLGGVVRERVPFSGYLFYKWAAHPDAEPDRWGAALDPAGIVAQAEKLVTEYGFEALKLKGGVFGPRDEFEAIKALRARFPDLPLRWDPNASWSVDTALKVGQVSEGILEYLEDPVTGIEAMADVAAQVPMPLATNMCVVAFDQLAPAFRRRAVGVVLSDHHYWGGLRRSLLLAGTCAAFGVGLSMHSNSHLGISLAAMTHLAAATPNLDYACDTHWPWKDSADDVIVSGVLPFADGAISVPTEPGLGVQLDRDGLARLHEKYLECGITDRDDAGYMASIDPAYRDRSLDW